jgi:hypothetical protein
MEKTNVNPSQQASTNEKALGWRGPMLIHLDNKGRMKNFLDGKIRC